jgi:predicted secreted protein
MTFEMYWVRALGGYVIVWWLTLFAFLPLWVKPSEPGDPGHAAGAPQQPRLLLKAAITTAVATVVWLGILVLVRSSLFNFRS